MRRFLILLPAAILPAALALGPAASAAAPPVPVGTLARPAGNALPGSGFPKVSCDSLPTGVWYYGRFQMCLEDGFTVNEVSGGKVVGTAKFSYAQQLSFSASSLTWTEADYATLDSVSGVSKHNSLGWVTKCSGSCSPAGQRLWKVTPIAVGQTLQGSTTFAGTPASGAAATLSATPTVTVVDRAGSPAAVPVTLFTSLTVRCDNGLAASGSAGCVVPLAIPVLSVSLASFGAGAAMIHWAQTHLSGHWGLQGTGQPLSRLASNVRANRKVVCDATFTPGSTGVASDTCDEFPFAATYQSGARNGVTSGSQCAQVTAVRTASTGTIAQQWAKIKVIGTPAGTEKCVRGHIPRPLNIDLGAFLGQFDQAQRLIDKDQYWVAVTP